MKIHITSIILFVNDVEKLKNFYCEHFQLEAVEEIAVEWVLLDAGGCQIGLHKIGKEYREAAGKEGKAGSNTKIVFDVEGDINEMRDQLIKQNITVGEVKTFPGYDYWICDGEDPEENVFQIRQKKSE